MRTWGRIPVDPTNPTGPKMWVEVDTAPDGNNDAVWLTTLIQELKLNTGEAPFYADHGIPAKESIVQQLFPDLAVALVQQRYAQYFASLIIVKVPGVTAPTYNVNVTLNNGTKLAFPVVPQ